jgi:hypothetical protein
MFEGKAGSRKFVEWLDFRFVFLTSNSFKMIHSVFVILLFHFTIGPILNRKDEIESSPTFTKLATSLICCLVEKEKKNNNKIVFKKIKKFDTVFKTFKMRTKLDVGALKKPKVKNSKRKKSERKKWSRRKKTIKNIPILQRPQPEPGMKEEVEDDNKMVCVSINDDFVLKQVSMLENFSSLSFTTVR